MKRTHEITRMLDKWSNGDEQALEDLMPLVYGELRKQAARFLRKERPNHTLQTTALINEAYLKLIDQRKLHFDSRAHFFALSARLMRRILVDHARKKNREKRGGNAETVAFDEMTVADQNGMSVDLLALDEALSRLEKHDERLARIVELKYFSGLSLVETAEALKISRTTVATDWAIAKAWLFRELTK
ncbi:MAG: sigma-70 family RNA polymerase sigma factor [Pyrinomonadaceae bacterium]|nr:sigma-70 family RNA polymerase sigma factor [Pyrinomonadaceae bacterium]